MKKIKFVILTFILAFSFSIQSNSKTVPASFADLAERLMPSVVNISTTQTVTTTTNPFPFNFLQDHPLKICLKNLELLKRENLQH
jgi:serine protease Do